MASSNSSEHSCTFSRGKNWHTYRYLETRLLELSRYITFTQDNKSTWSEALADLLILTGSAVDTFFRDMVECPCIQDDPNFQTMKEDKGRRSKKNNSQYRKENLKIEHFRDLYEPIYELSHNQVDIPFGLDYYGKIRPFCQFSVDKGIPDWWHAYNHLKHNYYDSLKEANLKNVISSLGGLLILHALHKCSQEYLVRNGLLKSGSVNPDRLIEDLRKSKIGCPKTLYIVGGCRIITPIFVFELRRI